MSVELCVFLDESALPSLDNWQHAISEAGYDLQLDNCSPHDHVGFWPTRLNGVECGFEYYIGPLDSTEADDVLSSIGERRHVARFIFGGDENDFHAATFSAAVLAHLSHGVFFDPQSGELVAGDRVFEWLKQQESNERERLMALAVKKWADITDRRCPRCDAPCPEYRKTCSVCRFEIGRA